MGVARVGARPGAVHARVIDRRTGLPRDLYRCTTCGKTSGAPRCRHRGCPDGNKPWAFDVWTVLAANLKTCPYVRMVVITAPGADQLPWDRTRCTHKSSEPCSGKIGCKVDRKVAAEWERRLQRQWCLLRQACVTQLNREGFSSPSVALVLEDQIREAVHLNLVMEEGPAAVRMHALLAEKARDYGFGFVDRQRVVMSGTQAAGYLSGYLTNKGQKKGDASVQSVAARFEARRRVWWCTPRLTKTTHVTMTTLRCGRRVLAAREGLCTPPTEGVAVLDWQAIDVATGAVLHVVWDLEGG